MALRGDQIILTRTGYKAVSGITIADDIWNGNGYFNSAVTAVTGQRMYTTVWWDGWNTVTTVATARQQWPIVDQATQDIFILGTDTFVPTKTFIDVVNLPTQEFLNYNQLLTQDFTTRNSVQSNTLGSISTGYRFNNPGPNGVCVVNGVATSTVERPS